MLQRITSQIQHEDIKLAELARQSQKESKRLKVLSTIATVYLPASLIAVCRLSRFRDAKSSSSLDNFQFQFVAVGGKQR